MKRKKATLKKQQVNAKWFAFRKFFLLSLAPSVQFVCEWFQFSKIEYVFWVFIAITPFAFVPASISYSTHGKRYWENAILDKSHTLKTFSIQQSKCNKSFARHKNDIS